ncbi:hypothetical protein BT69DRAFT_1350544 [Atractiella rhizophila]|nr:hypothetical protein BT69DRAFT_1350544 [Atractiella rhizophila]
MPYDSLATNHPDEGVMVNHLIAYRAPQGPTKSRPMLKWIIFSSSWLLGCVLVALGHHFFYAYANGHATTDFPVSQEWSIRIGSVLAFLWQNFAGAAISLAFGQLCWDTVKRKWMTIDQVNDLFQLKDSATSFLNFTLLRTAKLVIAISIIFRLASLSGIVTPATLTTTFTESSQIVMCSVPTVSLAQFDDQANAAGYTVPASLQQIAKTQSTYYSVPGFPDELHAEVYLGPAISNASLHVLVTGSPFANWKADCQSTNCTFSTSFQAPAFQCSNGTASAWHGVDSDTYQVGSSDYYWSAQSFRSATLDELQIRFGEDMSGNLTCNPYVGDYTIHVIQTGDSLAITSTALQIGAPIASANAARGILNNSEVVGAIQGIGENFVSWGMLNMIGISDSVFQMLDGSVFLHWVHGNSSDIDEEQVLASNDTLITFSSDSRFYNSNSTTRPTFEGLSAALPELMNNLSISVLSLVLNQSTTTQCFQTSSFIRYAYNQRTLLLAYLAGFIVTLAISFVSLLSVIRNRSAFQLNFIQFLLATRNPDLEGHESKTFGIELTEESQSVEIMYGYSEAYQRWSFKTKREEDQGAK